MLERDQTAIARALVDGPAYIPPVLFAGHAAQVERGLRVHANTISHARLVALEETFPRTRAYLGEGAFDRLSRAYVDGGGAQGKPVAAIGRGFDAWLAGEADPLAADLARVEWVWLACYHAAEAPALRLADLRLLDEPGLLALPVRRHPAAATVTLTSDAAPLLDPALPAGTGVLLITRPDAEVRLFAAIDADRVAIEAAENITPLGNLIERLAELQQGDEAAIVPLIAAGAFERV
ncbi:putative DNA-binding domain-containing protein [Sphingopyxis sp. KK2]|uniref:HvfC/BufC family peptide modification chaperone n=1 Tax=Sphingopyxis sp. KK2 TaxID=1855727 RepID=UPI00097E70A3|nr:putative DNA-binding domain-containing protein [Sphingopyxis sp. KK2]